MYNYFQLIGTVKDISNDYIMTLEVPNDIRQDSKTTKFYINVKDIRGVVKEINLINKRIGVRGHLIFTNMLELVGDHIIIIDKENFGE